MNIFLHHNRLVLGDLGLARDASLIVKSSLSNVGTVHFMAPETVDDFRLIILIILNYRIEYTIN